jgi:glycerol-3-phosphate acyltransferase PlsX
MNIALDMMGGDFAPDELVKGVRDYISDKPPALVSLIGDEQQLVPLLEQYDIPALTYRIVPSTEVIGMHEHPLKALKEKPNSSIAIGFGLLAAG